MSRVRACTGKSRAEQMPPAVCVLVVIVRRFYPESRNDNRGCCVSRMNARGKHRAHVSPPSWQVHLRVMPGASTYAYLKLCCFALFSGLAGACLVVLYHYFFRALFDSATMLTTCSKRATSWLVYVCFCLGIYTRGRCFIAPFFCVRLLQRRVCERPHARKLSAVQVN